MSNIIDNIREIRKQIIKDSSSKKLENSPLEKFSRNINEYKSVIIKEIKEEAPHVKSFILGPNKDKGVNELDYFKAGEYISIKLTIDGVTTTRAYSLASSPKDALKGFYKITIKAVPDGLVSNYMVSEVKVGDEILVSKPIGDFGYFKTRDEQNVIGIAGGSGITPFISLAESIIDGDEDCNLTVFACFRTYEDLIFKEEIAKFNKSKKVNFIVTLTREEKDGFKHGYITKEMLDPYIKEFNTFLICGPKNLCKSMNEILLDFNVPRKSVHYENYFSNYEPEEVKTFKLRILIKGEAKVITCKSDETLLAAMEKGEIEAPSLCRVGECGFCRSILIDGKIKMIGGTMPKALSENDYIHPCVVYPESDIVIKLDV